MRTDVYRVGQAAELLGVSDDTLRRWADSGRLPTSTSTDGHGVRVVAGRDLAALALELGGQGPDREGRSARNTFAGSSPGCCAGT